MLNFTNVFTLDASIEGNHKETQFETARRLGLSISGDASRWLRQDKDLVSFKKRIRDILMSNNQRFCVNREIDRAIEKALV